MLLIRIKTGKLYFALLLTCLLLPEIFGFWGGESYYHPIYYRRFGFPSRPLKHGETPKYDKDVQDRIRSFIDPFYVPTTPSYEDIKPYLGDMGIKEFRNQFPNIIG